MSIETRCIASRSRRRYHFAGFTLIEVLVVLVIVAIITAVAVMAFGQFGRGRRERIVAEQFTRVIQAAREQAILKPSVLGLGISGTGYYFYQFATTQHTHEWKPLASDSLSNDSAFKNLFAVHVKYIEGFKADQKMQAASPAILFLPSGYVTPFILELKGSAHDFLITVKNNGVVTMVSQTHEKK